jgi:hypothetical protein
MSARYLPTFAPVAVFAYKRVDHLRRTIDSLIGNVEASATDVHVFCDGPKGAQDQAATDAVRRYVAQIRGFQSIRAEYRQRNYGLAANIIDGVSRLTAAHGRVIVVEDDLMLSPHFLRYMNDGLDLYASDTRVASLHGYCYPVGRALPETFFLRGADCWGWATWQRAWTHFRADGAALLDELEARHLTHEFDFDGQYAFTRMLRDQVARRNDSWAIRWHASCYLDGLLTLYPGRSLVHNTGNDASGTHCDERLDYVQTVATEPVRVERQPVEVSAVARAAFVDFFRAGRPRPLARVARALRRALKVRA